MQDLWGATCDSACWPRDRGIPPAQHYGAFDRETIGPLSLWQSEEGPLHRVVENRLLEVQAKLRRSRIQSTAYLDGTLDAHISAPNQRGEPPYHHAERGHPDRITLLLTIEPPRDFAVGDIVYQPDGYDT